MARKQDLYEVDLTEQIIGAPIEVHKELGPGLLESAYEHALCHELGLRRLKFERQKLLPLVYKGLALDCRYRADLIVEERVVVEVKAVDEMHPVYEAQLLTYMRLAGVRVGLLANFNELVLKDGLKRRVL